MDGQELRTSFLEIRALIVVVAAPILEVRTPSWRSSIWCMAALIRAALEGWVRPILVVGEFRLILVVGGEARETGVAARVLRGGVGGARGRGHEVRP